MEISAIVVNYRTAERLPALVAALRASGAQTIVVDSASPDREKARMSGSDIFLPLEENRGFGAAANEGARKATKPLLLFCNPDVKFPPAALAALERALEGHTACAPRLVSHGARQAGDAGPRPTVLRAFLYALGGRTLFHGAAGRVGWLSAAFLLVRAEAFGKLGGFDERFFLFGEDVDLGRRLALAGHHLRYVPEVEVEHEGAASYRGSELEGTWARGLRQAHAASGANVLARALFASFFGLGLALRACASSSPKRGRLLRAARFALSPAPLGGPPREDSRPASAS